MQHAGRIALQIVVSASFIGVLLWRGDLGDLGGTLRSATWGWMIAAATVMSAAKATHGVRWWLLVRRAHPVPAGGTVLVLLAATGVSVILPLRAGAALQFQVMRRRYGVERAAIAGTLVLEGLLDAAAAMALALTAAPLLGIGHLVAVRPLLAASAVVAVAVGAVWLVVRRTGDGWTRVLPPRLRARAARSAREVGHGFAALGSARYVLLVELVTLVDWALGAVANWLVGRAFGLDLPPQAYLAVEIVGNLAGAVPLTQSNIGPYELTVRETLAVFGAAGDSAAAFAIASHAAVIVAIALTGLAATWALRLGWEDLFYLRAETPMERDAAAPATVSDTGGSNSDTSVTR
jgi:uncharacterized membrane protein YbhN (UPF0104 family)